MDSQSMEKGAPLLSPGISPGPRSNTTPQSGFRDLPFLLLFIVNCGAVSYLAFSKGLDQLKKTTDVDPDTTDDVNYSAMCYVVAGCFATGLIMSSLFLTFLIKFSATCIDWSLKFNIVLYAFLTCVAFAYHQPIFAIISIVLCLISMCYYRAVKPRIPFASANLKIACNAIRSHIMLYFVSIFCVFLGVGYVFLWFLSMLGLDIVTSDDDDTNSGGGDNNQVSSSQGLLMFCMLISYFWGAQVFKNIGHVTTSGVVASWWFEPSRSNIVGSALTRSCTTSLGSIAMGSLFVAIIQALKALVDNKRRGQDNWLSCIASCILGCLQNIIEYFNRWAFVYVGIYGTSFVTSGKNVMALFKNRGWTAIINDNLIENVMFCGSLMIGAVVGCVSMAAGQIGFSDDTIDGLGGEGPMLAVMFFVGSLVGFMLNLVMVGIIDSGVATVFVCFAEAPGAFENSHPALYDDLSSAWRLAHPDVF